MANPLYIVNISDIHFGPNTPNNQGLVLNAFFDDLKEQLTHVPIYNRYCIISGDLVNIGSNAQTYTSFSDKFLSKLYFMIPRGQVFATPGNHDLRRNAVHDYIQDHQSLCSKVEQENRFNAALVDNKYINSKFAAFTDFSVKYLKISDFDIKGYSTNLIPELSVLFLNSSLLAAGGLEEQPNDKGLLSIDTSILYKWIEESNGRKRILVMHHPLDWLCDYAKDEIKKVLPKIDLFISGHVHDQEVSWHIQESSMNLHLCSPQLFSDKRDLNGYSIIEWQDNHATSVIYRQWTKRRNKFTAGSDFSDTDDGIYHVDHLLFTHEDVVQMNLKKDLENDLELMGVQSHWCNRILSDRAESLGEEKHIDYIDIIESTENYQIVAPHDFGLTCFGRFLVLKFWEQKHEYWIYIDFKEVRLSTIERIINSYINDQLTPNRISGVVIDNWNGQRTEANNILQKIKNQCEDIRIILLTNFRDTAVIQGLETDESKNGFQLYYLRELRRHDIRQIVSDYKSINDFNAEVDFVVDRICADIDELNMHRIPSNCIQLLLAYKDNFESRPVNRSRVFNRIIHNLFQNSRTLYYNDEITEEECCQVMGCLCFELYKEEKDFFTEEEYYKIVKFNYKDKYSDDMLQELLNTLKSSSIIIENTRNLYFRFSYWIHYFVAFRMYENSSCYDYMMGRKLYFDSEIMEFHTGINNKCDQSIELINQKLSELIDEVKSGLNIQINDPYKFIKWGNNEPQTGKSKELIDEDIKSSRLPNDMKDDLLDMHYDNSKPYNQQIMRVFDEYNVRNMMNLSHSAARTLRNCQLVSDELVGALMKTMFSSLEELIKILFALTPTMAKSGYAGYGGARFKLEDGFPKEYNSCMIAILCMIPFNVLAWYKNDVFSDKLVYLFRRELKTHPNPVIRHFVAMMLATCRPRGWKSDIQSYISGVGKNTFYLSNISDTLQYNYRISSMSDSDLNATRELIKSCIAKHETGCLNPGMKAINKIGDDRLPNRES